MSERVCGWHDCAEPTSSRVVMPTSGYYDLCRTHVAHCQKRMAGWGRKPLLTTPLPLASTQETTTHE